MDQDSIAVVTPFQGDCDFDVGQMLVSNLKKQSYSHKHITWYILDDSGKSTLHDLLSNEEIKSQLAPITIKYKRLNLKINSYDAKRNVLVKFVKENTIVIMNEDCIYKSDWLQKMVSSLQKQKVSLLTSKISQLQLVQDQLGIVGSHDKLSIFTKQHFQKVGGFVKTKELIPSESNQTSNEITPIYTLISSSHPTSHKPILTKQDDFTQEEATLLFDIFKSKNVSHESTPKPSSQPIQPPPTKANVPDESKQVKTIHKNDLPCVGLAMPTYCRRKFMPNIVNNLKRQTYPMDKVTLYIYDDSPPGKGFYDLFDELQSQILPVKLVMIRSSEQIKPLGRKRNKLVSCIQEDYIANMDDDDYYQGTWLMRVITTLLANPDKGLVGCVEMPHIYIHSEFDKWKLILNNPNAHLIKDNKDKLDFIGEASIAHTKQYFIEEGGYSEQMIQEGIKFINKAKSMDISCLDVLISVNLHPDQVGHVSWNTSNKNALFDKQEVGFKMPEDQALQVARCVFDDQTFEFGDSNPFKMPEIAVVTPTRNNRVFQDVMIANMKRQTYPQELIHWYILDDSSDKTQRLDEKYLKSQLPKVNIIYKRVPKPINPIGLKRNMLVNGVKQDIVVHMDDCHHYMKAYLNIMVTELIMDKDIKIVGSTVVPFTFVHDDVNKWKLVGIIFSNIDDPVNIVPCMTAYYKSYLDKMGGFDEDGFGLEGVGSELKKLIENNKSNAKVINALDKLMLYLCSHPESNIQLKRDGWNTQFTYKWYSQNETKMDQLQISDEDKCAIINGVMGGNKFETYVITYT